MIAQWTSSVTREKSQLQAVAVASPIPRSRRTCLDVFSSSRFFHIGRGACVPKDKRQIMTEAEKIRVLSVESSRRRYEKKKSPFAALEKFETAAVLNYGTLYL